MSLADELRAAMARTDHFASGGLVRSRSLADALREDGWAFEATSRDEHGYVDGTWWPPHLAAKRGLTPPDRGPAAG